MASGCDMCLLALSHLGDAYMYACVEVYAPSPSMQLSPPADEWGGGSQE